MVAALHRPNGQQARLSGHARTVPCGRARVPVAMRQMRHMGLSQSAHVRPRRRLSGNVPCVVYMVTRLGSPGGEAGCGSSGDGGVFLGLRRVHVAIAPRFMDLLGVAYLQGHLSRVPHWCRRPELAPTWSCRICADEREANREQGAALAADETITFAADFHCCTALSSIHLVHEAARRDKQHCRFGFVYFVQL
jgi:hypothetical protein